MTGKIYKPIVLADGKPVTAGRVTLTEHPASPAHASFMVAGKCTIEPATPVAISAGGRTLLSGLVTDVHLLRTPDGPLYTIDVHREGEDAWKPQSRREVKQTTSALIARLVGNAEVQSAPVCDEKHPSLTLLREPAWPVAARLALLSGRFLLSSAEGARLSRPDQPRSPRPLPLGAIVQTCRPLAPELELKAFRAGSLGEVITVKRAAKKSVERVSLFFEEAVSPKELNAAADAILAAEKTGTFHADAGTLGLSVNVGDWLQAEGQPRCVTARTCAWTENVGWSVQLISEYPWRILGSSPAPPSAEPAVVKGFDDETGMIKVALPWHDNLEILAGLRADRAAKDDFAMHVPHVGDAGSVLFLHGAEHATYLGAPLPAGTLSAAELGKMVSIVRSPDVKVTLATDGTVKQQFKQQESIASKFVFKKA